MAEDSDNALLSAGGPRSAPVYVNPAASMGRGMAIAGRAYELREKQAQEAWGNILQQSTDANGNVDYGKAQAAAAKDPMATMGMMSALKDTSSLRGSQFNLNTAQNNSVNAAATAALAEPDDEKMKQTVYQQMMRQVQMGLIPLDRAMAALHNMSTDPAEMRKQLETIRVQTLPEKERQDWIYGTRPAVSAGGATVFPSVPRPGADQPTVVVPHTMTPAELNATTEFPDLRKTLPDGSPNPDYGKKYPVTAREKLEGMGYTIGPNGEVTPPGQSSQPGQPGPLGTGRYNVPPELRRPGATAAPPAPPAPGTAGAPGTASVVPPAGAPGSVPPPPGGAPGAAAPPSAGSGFGAALAPAAPGPQSFNVPPGASPVPSYVAAIQAGQQQARYNALNGTMVAGPGAGPTPDTSDTPSRFATGTPNPLRPDEPGWGTGNVAAYGMPRGAPAAPPPARVSVQPAPLSSRPASGASPGEEEEMKSAGPRFQADTDAGAKAQAHQAILGNMLADAAQFVPGPDAQSLTRLRARIQQINTQLGLRIPVDDKALAAGESFDKLAAQVADAQGAGSDERLRVTTAANPHPGMSGPGVDLVLRQLQGNDDYIQAKAMLAQQYPNRSDYQGFLSSINNLDPRVFQYERMQPGQATAWFNALDKRAQQAFMTSHKWAEGKGLVPARPGG